MMLRWGIIGLFLFLMATRPTVLSDAVKALAGVLLAIANGFGVFAGNVVS